MPITIIGPQTSPFPSRVLTPMVDVKRAWSDAWIPVPELRLRQAVLAMSSQQASTCQIVYPYGRLKQPWQSSVGVYLPWDLSRWWLRVRFFSREGVHVAWVGRIATEDRELHGAAVTASGVQSWVAWGPDDILRKIAVSESYWLNDTFDSGRAKRIQWVPAMNGRDERKSLVGNRSATQIDDVYLYGGADTWTHYEYAQYLIHHFIDESATGGPTWTLGGQADILKDFQTTIEMEVTQTAEEILHALIPRHLGVDYVIYHTAAGFEIFVFPLTAVDMSFGGKRLPKNPRLVRVVASTSHENRMTRIVKTAEHQYEKIRVLGARCVACFSLWGDDAQPPNAWQQDTLESKWTSALETAYEAGAGTSAWLTAEDHDRARQDERFRPVFQFLAAPDDWDPRDQKMPVKFDSDGQYDASNTDDYQVKVRETLDWTPLREGFDYTQDPPADGNPAGHQPDLLPPAVWICDLNSFDPATEPVYYRADQVKVAVDAPGEQWGVQLSAGPNHRMAQTHFSGAKPSAHLPEFDYDMSVATIAIRTDQRLSLTLEIPGGAARSGGTMDVQVEDAEFWVLLGDTVVGIDADGHLKRSPPDPVVLRNDRSRILQVMAGALSRYYTARCRAEIQQAGLHAWGLLVGQILVAVEQAGNAQIIQAPITAVEWTVPEGDDPQPLTTIRTGFAE